VIWKNHSNTTSFLFDHCYFEGNYGSENGIDIGLFSDSSKDDDNNIFPDTEMNINNFVDCISRTIRSDSSNPKLIIRKSSSNGYNNLVPFSHPNRIYIDNGENEGLDMLYCGCVDYACKTIIYGLNRTDFVYSFYFILFYLFIYFLFFLVSN
jgi:hypothetical protein